MKRKSKNYDRIDLFDIAQIGFQWYNNKKRFGATRAAFVRNYNLWEVSYVNQQEKKALSITACKVRMGVIEGTYHAKSGHPRISFFGGYLYVPVF